MKKLILVFCVFAIVSCKNNTGLVTGISSLMEDPNKDLYGNWKADNFGINDNIDDAHYFRNVNIIIKKVEDDKVYGQSIIEGIVTPVEGNLKEKQGKSYLILNISNDLQKGKIKFQIFKDSMRGKWISDNKKSPHSQDNYIFKKESFKYNPKLMINRSSFYSFSNSYVDRQNTKMDSLKDVSDNGEIQYYPYRVGRKAGNIVEKLNASTMRLAEKDLKNLKKLELELIHNTVLARHGYAFKTKDVRQFFDWVDWYIPVSDNVSKDLTKLEKENIQLLKRFEKYATDNYERFGR